MKHLNPNLDSVTNAEIAAADTGATVMNIGVVTTAGGNSAVGDIVLNTAITTDNDIVNATAPALTPGTSFTVPSNSTIVINNGSQYLNVSGAARTVTGIDLNDGMGGATFTDDNGVLITATDGTAAASWFLVAAAAAGGGLGNTTGPVFTVLGVPATSSNVADNTILYWNGDSGSEGFVNSPITVTTQTGEEGSVTTTDIAGDGLSISTGLTNISPVGATSGVGNDHRFLMVNAGATNDSVSQSTAISNYLPTAGTVPSSWDNVGGGRDLTVDGSAIGGTAAIDIKTDTANVTGNVLAIDFHSTDNCITGTVDTSSIAAPSGAIGDATSGAVIAVTPATTGGGGTGITCDSNGGVFTDVGENNITPGRGFEYTFFRSNIQEFINGIDLATEQPSWIIFSRTTIASPEALVTAIFTQAGITAPSVDTDYSVGGTNNMTAFNLVYDQDVTDATFAVTVSSINVNVIGGTEYSIRLGGTNSGTTFGSTSAFQSSDFVVAATGTYRGGNGSSFADATASFTIGCANPSTGGGATSASVAVNGDLTTTGTITGDVTGDVTGNVTGGIDVTEAGTGSAGGTYQFRIADSGNTGLANFITFVRE